MNSKRIIEFDFIQGLCMLYIVGFWHLNNYLNPIFRFSGATAMFLEGVTTAVLATFTFISGYMLRKYEFSTFCDVLYFYKKRLMRFYPLFVLSALCMLVLHGIDANQFLLGITGLAMFSPQPLNTLWFISMLMLFYLLTPIVKTNGIVRGWGGHILPIAILVLFAVLCMHGNADSRLFRYALLYAIGLNCRELQLKKRIWMIVAVISAIISIFLLYYGRLTNDLQFVVVAISGVALILSLGFLIPVGKIEKPIQFFAYSSMAAYLFHREIFGVSLFFFGTMGEIERYMTWSLAIITLCVTFIVSWVIQQIYDKAISRLTTIATKQK